MINLLRAFVFTVFATAGLTLFLLITISAILGEPAVNLLMQMIGE